VDAAVFRAKELGRNRCHLFSPEDDRGIENIHSRLRQKERILRALEEDRFEPWFQPILDLGDQQIHHYEALARMREDGNIVLPGAFIPTAETLGLIDAIDRTITQKTIHYQARLKQQSHDLSFAINISAKHLGSEELLDFLRTTIEESGADPSRLVFEITETAAIRDLEQAITFIKALKTLGCRFALDDFGVGFTSFIYLREMNVDFIKIDGAFIRRLHEHRDDQGIVKAIITVARDMRVKTVAEFVEQEETLHLLKKFEVDYAQGFFIGKPAPAPNLAQ
jgi:EAL domain-containing protein (putative c-di-GMP-specific phosphodiesterase class I)